MDSGPLTHARESYLPPVLAFFHFNRSSRIGGRTSDEAFRALAAQLIAIHRNEDPVMDALLILFDKDAGGQQQASANEIYAVLRILMQQWPTFLVIDGVDECSDSSEFLNDLWNILTDLDCRVLLLSRPDLTFPPVYRTWTQPTWQMQLSTLDNSAGIQSFLRQRFNVMTDEFLFGHKVVDDAVVDDLAKRSNGMFLWATLLVNYLECPALSPMERFATLQEVSLLEGLGTLYNKILGTLERRYERQRHLAADTFKWISSSLYPLGLEELRRALAIVPGDPTHDLQLLSNYPRCIQQITCALVDIDLYGTISFIHLSLKEFLERDPNCHPFFSLRDQQAIHEHLATRCISYLVYDIPEEPLRRLERCLSLETGTVSCGGEARLEDRLTPCENRELVLKKYPFLRYASFCWVTHLVRSLSSQSQPHLSNQALPSHTTQEPDPPRARHMRRRFSSTVQAHDNYPNEDLGMSARRTRRRLAFSGEDHAIWQNNPMYSNFESLGSVGMRPSFQAPGAPQFMAAPMKSSSSEQTAWIPLLSAFLVRRLSVTAWVEACWTFNFPPNLSRLDPLLQQLSSGCSTQTIGGRETWWISAGIHQLSEALKELRGKHRELLSKNPTLIWQQHIVSATDPEFWPLWKVDTNDQLDEDQNAIMVRAGFHPQYDLPPAPSGSTLATLPMFL